ncbi:MAG: hypothetical protein Q8K70_09975 [Bacteroidota bacterium]|nr:hypothetical protein [Bacteroidota bacterium]
MQVSRWIKPIGILCIIFGIFGLTENFAKIILIEVIESKKINPSINIQSHDIIIAYIGIGVYFIYLVSSIFFLLKKSFSLRMIYITLIISILYIVIPLLIINKSDPSGFLFDYRLNFSNLLSPAIDIALLFGIVIISKNYYKKPDEFIESKILTPFRLKILTFIGLLCFSIPLSIFILWQYAYNMGDNQFNRVEIFKSYFPNFLQERYDTAYLSLAFCLLSIILSSLSLKLSGYLWKTLNIIILVLAILLMLLNLFQMM